MDIIFCLSVVKYRYERSDPMHTVRLLLKAGKHDKQIMEKRFRAAHHIHNVVVKHARKCLRKLSYDKEYKALKAEYSILLKKDKLSRDDISYKKKLSQKMNKILRLYGLSEYSFHSYIKVSAKQFRRCLSSQQIQKEATRVWRGVDNILFGNGKELHFKKFSNFYTISGKSNKNGVKFHKDTYSIEWLGLKIQCKLPRNSGYILESLRSNISYCDIERKMFPNGWHYYVIIYLKGDAPRTLGTAGNKDTVTGLDIGTSTVAAVSDHTAVLLELAPKCNGYNKKIARLIKSMDISRRNSNPGKFRPDGTIDASNKNKWVYSNTYLRNRNKLKSLYRQKKAYIKQSHEEMINRLLEESVHFIVEDMYFKGLQRKARNTGRSSRVTDIKQKDGSVKQVHKYKRRKRFGRSLNNRAPASFITILTRKAGLYGGSVYKVNTKVFRASQYNHVTDDYVKTELSERMKMIGVHMVQRDLYSAFLLKNSNNELNKPDRDKCILGFDRFIELQDNLINTMKIENISMKQCFGF